MSNTKTQKKRPYNMFKTVVVKTAKVDKVTCFVKAVKPNSKDASGMKKHEGVYYNGSGRCCNASDWNAERFSHETVYYFEVGASDGLYRKCTTKQEALRWFEQLMEFEKRQTEIK